VHINLSNNIICIIPLLLNVIPALEKLRKAKFLFSLGRGIWQDNLQNTLLSFNATSGQWPFPVVCGRIPHPRISLLWCQTLPFQAEKLALFFTAWAPLTVFCSSSSNLLFGGHAEEWKKKKLRLLSPIQYKLRTFLYLTLHGAHIPFYSFPPSPIQLRPNICWSWWTSSILEVTQSCCCGNCGNKLAGKKPGVRKTALGSRKISSFQLPNARAQSAFHCSSFGTLFGISEQEQNSGLRACVLCWCKFCTSSHHRLWRQNRAVTWNAWKAMLVPVFGTKDKHRCIYFSVMKRWNYYDRG